MTDININEVTNGQVVNGVWVGTGVFDKLLGAVNENIKLQFDAGRIKGQDYANVYLGALQMVLSQSTDYVLREKLVEAQIDDALKGIELKEQQIESMQLEDNIKQSQNEKDLLLKDSELLTNEKQRLALDKDMAVKTAQIVSIQKEDVIKEKQALYIAAQTLTEASQKLDIEKATELKTAQISNMGKDTELKEYDLTIIKPKELEIKQKELELHTIESNRMRDMTEAELEKQWGYVVTRDGNGDLVLGATTGTGVIDKEILLKEAQKALTYTERIGKDKEVAAMGLDNVVKLREVDRVTNSVYVYQPAYQG